MTDMNINHSIDRLDETEAQRIMTVDLTNNVPESKGVLWSNWKQYPQGDIE